MSDTPYDLSGLPPVVKEAIERYRLEEEAFGKQRAREKDDLEFQIPENQWPKSVQEMRKAQVVNGILIPEQPMLSLPTLDQPAQLILNQERAAHLGVTVHPLSEDSDDDTAEVIQGLYRHIEVDCGAGRTRSWAFERGFKCGRGGYRVLTVPDDNGEEGDLKIVLKRTLYQESIRFDPFAEEPDFHDADWGMVSTWVPLERLKRQYKGKGKKLPAAEEGPFAELATAIPGWLRDDKHGKACLVVEYFRKVYDDSGDNYTIRWSKLTCTDELDSEDWDGRYIPLVPTVGRELIPFDDERHWVGIYRPNKDAVRLVNYAASNAVSVAALEPKAPWMVAEGQDEGHELEFQLSNVRNFPALHYKPTSLGGNLVGPPQRTQVDTSRLGPSMQLLQMGQQFVHAGTGAFEAALGQAAPNAKTKGGTLALQQQHDQGNSNWLDNQVEITLACEARIVLDLIPHVYDRPGRIARILDKEDESKMVMLNKPFVMQGKRPVAADQQPPTAMMGQPPQQPGSVLGLQQPAPQRKPKHYDLTKGRYGVIASAGKSYKSRVEEGSDRLGQLLQADPALMPILGPNWMRFQDFPGHDEAFRILKKMRDHAMPWLAEEDDQPDAAQQLAAAKMQLQQLQQQLQQAAEAIRTDQAKQQATVAKSRIDAASSVAIQRMKDATAITVAQINALVKGVQMDSEAMNEAAALGAEDRRTAIDAHFKVHGQAHEVAMLAQEHAHALDIAQQQHEQSMQAAEQGQAHALEQGAQGHEQALEQGQQAADLAPEPASNGGES